MPNDQPQQLPGTSQDIAAENRSRLKQLFPSVFTETIDDRGRPKESIDFEKLKAELGTFSDLFESRREYYGMNWPGKKDALRLIQQRSHATLKPCREESVDFDTTENLFIEGDNLEVLKLLQTSYYGRVKMIYIDPPYNTGNEFIYPDNYSESLDTYLEYAGLKDSEGRKFSTNTPNEGRFHTKWLNMMYPRLYLARNLLRDDGVIFISIDDNEVSNLRKMCDEIFGEENFITTLIWKSRQIVDSRNKNNASTDHEYIIVYSKSSDAGQLKGKAIKLSKYSNPDNDPRGPWMSNSILGLANASQRPNLHYTVKDPETGNEFDCPADSGWRYSKITMSEKIEDGRIVFPKSEDGRPREKKFLSELGSQFTGFSSVLSENVGFTLNGSRELRDLFEGKIFDFPKPASLLNALVNQGSSNNDIILDFFAGSAATAHAVLELNKQDNGNRKFMLVQLPEPCSLDSEAFKAGYKSIADIGKERIRRVIRKLGAEEEGMLDLDASASQDRGFKVLKLDSSNFRKWQRLDPSISPEELLEELRLHVDHIDPDASAEDLLYEILFKAGLTLVEPVETVTLAGSRLFSVAGGELLVSLEDRMTKELIDAVVEAKPKQFICLDAAFHGNDQLKANAVQAFNACNMQKEQADQILFRTV